MARARTQAGRRIVEEAKEIRARAVVMELPPRRSGQTLFGKTIETVLAERPCRVVLLAEPAAQRDGAGAHRAVPPRVRG